MNSTTWGDICTLQYGKALRDYPAEPSDATPFRVFGTNGPIGWTAKPLVEQEGIIIGRKGVYRGVHYSPAPFFVIDTAFFVRFKADIDLKWAYYKLLTVDINRIDVGAAIPTTNRDSFYTIPVKVPSKAVQTHIADILAAYDDLIENNHRRIQLLEQSARLLYKEWFVNLRFPGHEHVKIVDGVPEGWDKKKVIDLADIVMGQSPKSEFYNEAGDGLPFHQGVANFGERFVQHKFYCTQINRLSEPGDILVSVRAPVGRLNITLDQIVIGRGLSAIRSKTGHQSFLYYQLKSHFYKEDMIGAGAIFAAVTKKELEAQELLSPPDTLVRTFEETTCSVDAQIKTLHLQNDKLKQARDLLLPRLMNGEINL